MFAGHKDLIASFAGVVKVKLHQETRFAIETNLNSLEKPVKERSAENEGVCGKKVSRFGISGSGPVSF